MSFGLLRQIRYRSIVERKDATPATHAEVIRSNFWGKASCSVFATFAEDENVVAPMPSRSAEDVDRALDQLVSIALEKGRLSID